MRPARAAGEQRVPEDIRLRENGSILMQRISETRARERSRRDPALRPVRRDDNDRGRTVLQKCAAIYSLMEKRAREGHLPVTRQALESALLLVTRGVGPGYYQMAGFWERGLSWQDKTGQLSAREYRRVVENFNPEHYRKLSQNKIAEKAILTLFGLPTPRFLGRLSAHVGMDARGAPLRGAGDLGRVLDAQRPDAVVFKELEGHGGKGVRIADLQRGDQGWLVRPLCGDVSIPLEEYVRDALRLDDDGDWLARRAGPARLPQ